MHVGPGQMASTGHTARRIILKVTQGHRAAFIRWMVALSVAGGAGLALDPAGVGGLAYLCVSGILILLTIFGPLVQGARPVRVWMFQTLSAAFLMLALFASLVPVTIGPLRYIDIVYIPAYAFLGVWLTVLARRFGKRYDANTYLDSFAATVGTILALWATVLAPLVGGAELPFAMVLALYPTLSVLSLALLVHLVLRMGGLALSALRWLLFAMVVLVLVEFANSVTGVLFPPGEFPAVVAFYVLFFFGLAMAATDPSVLELANGPPPRAHRRSNNRRVALIIFAVSPAVLATAIPVTGTLDIIIRTVLVTVILVLLFARLSRTMSALSRAEADSSHRATHDELTGLLNRAALFDALADVTASNRTDGMSTAVLFLDCDDFKYVNDTWGHIAGDTLLTSIAAGLPQRLGSTDLLTRHGGDEFVIVSAVRDVTEAVTLAERVRAFFDTPIPILPHRVHHVTMSIGVAVSGPHEHPAPDTLVNRADLAMYEGKRQGRGRIEVFDDHLAQRSRTRASIGDRLGDAIRADAFNVELQPIMGGPDYGRLIGWEALVRWRDTVLGEVPPDIFVTLAEQHGLIDDLGAIVLRRACRKLAHLRTSLSRPDLALFVNTSPAQLTGPRFAAMVTDALRAAGLPPGCLWLDMTETLLVDRGPDVLATIEELRTLGVHVCIDDFGTGYASLSTLLRLPVDCVKVDRSLISRLGVDHAAQQQLRAVLNLLNSLGIERIVAEGVETRQQEADLLAMGYPMVQGWLYGMPATPEEVLATLGPAHSAPVTDRRPAGRPASPESPC